MQITAKLDVKRLTDGEIVGIPTIEVINKVNFELLNEKDIENIEALSSTEKQQYKILVDESSSKTKYFFILNDKKFEIKKLPEGVYAPINEITIEKKSVLMG